MDNKDLEQLEEETDDLVDNDIEELPSEEVIEDSNDFYNQNLNNQIRNIRRQNKGNQNTINRLRQRNANTMTKGVEAPKSTPSSSNEEDTEDSKQSSHSNIGQKISDITKEASHQVKEKVKTTVKTATKKVAAVLLKNPYVLVIIGVFLLIMIIPVLWGAYDNNSNGNNLASGGSYDPKCNLNSTTVDLTLDDGSYSVKNLSLEDYILGVVYAEIGSSIYADGEEEYAKAQMIIAKSYALKTGNYDSESKHITVKASTYNQAWCDVYSGCMFYSTGSGAYWYYSKSSGISKSGASDYMGGVGLNETNLAKAKETYKSIEHLFLVNKDFSGEIKDYNDIAQTGFVDYTQTFLQKKALEGYTYEKLIQSLGTDEYINYANDRISSGKSSVSISHANSHKIWFSNIKTYSLGEFCQYTPGSGGSCNTSYPLDEGYTITSGYGPRKSPTAGASTNHQGIDFGIAGGSPIYAVADGVVTISEYGSCTGNWAVIGHDLDGDGNYDYYTEYMHQQVLPYVKVGDVVKGGQQIGIVGTTGCSTGNHLHFGIKDSNNKHINPTNILEQLKTKTSVFDKAKVCENFVNTEDNNFSSNNNGSASGGSANTCSNGVVTSTQPDPSIAINYWHSKGNINKNDFIYPTDSGTNYSLGAHPKNFKYTNLTNMKNYSGIFAWPVSPTENKYTYVYEHNGIDIMAKIGTPIYSPISARVVYSEWGHTVNKGCDETAYSVKLELDTPFKFEGKTIKYIFLTHMSGIMSYCPRTCSKRVEQGELIGFVGNAAGTAESTGGLAPHLHMTFCGDEDCASGNSLTTSQIERVYNIKSGDIRKAGE